MHPYRVFDGPGPYNHRREFFGYGTPIGFIGRTTMQPMAQIGQEKQCVPVQYIAQEAMMGRSIIVHIRIPHDSDAPWGGP